MNRRRTALTLASMMLLGGCATSVTAPVPSPTPAPLETAQGNPAGTCANPAASYEPLSPLPAPGSLPAKSPLAFAASIGYLVVGVVSEQAPLVSRDATTSELKGFEMDLVSRLSKVLEPYGISLRVRVLEPAEALGAVTDRDVDLLVGGFAATCGRWNAAATSASYLGSEQRFLTHRGEGLADAAAAKGRRVCVVAGTPYAEGVPGATVVARRSATECLVALQDREVDAVTDTAPVLAGLAKQDPFVEVGGTTGRTWDYVVTAPKSQAQLVQMTNAVLAQWVSEGGWAAAHATHLAPLVGAGQAPTPTYGRPLS